MEALVRVEDPIENVKVIEIFKLQLDNFNCSKYPVTIDGLRYEFVKNKYGFWEPLGDFYPLLIEVRWFISGLIETLI